MASIIGTNAYRFLQHYKAQGKGLADYLPEALQMARDAGIEAWEPALSSPEDAERIGDAIREAGLKFVSFYSGGRLSDPEKAGPETERIIATARAARPLGVTHCVMNPDPISAPKTDAQLRTQRSALCTIATELKAMGISLDYHMHTPEFQNGGCEFVSMLQGAREAGMNWCLDSHWLYRGTGHSQLGFEAYLSLFGERIGSLHLRQSCDHVWKATLGPGDLDYRPLIEHLKRIQFRGLFTVELAVEKGTPTDLDLVDAHRQSVAWVRETFPANFV